LCRNDASGLTTEPIVRVKTYQSGLVLYLESDSGTDVSRIGLETAWGGSIVEVSLNGTDYVNESGTGREVQAAQTQFSPELYASEQWGAFVNSSDQGLTVFVPGMAPYIGGFAYAGSPGPTGSGTDYFAARTFFSFGPNSVLEGDVYLVAGDYKHARQVIYDLHGKLPAKDIFTPNGSVDSPAANTQVPGKISVSGWALDDVAASVLHKNRMKGAF
jgi:hypothetical protein